LDGKFDHVASGLEDGVSSVFGDLKVYGLFFLPVDAGVATVLMIKGASGGIGVCGYV